jgi:hypothetical protein
LGARVENGRDGEAVNQLRERFVDLRDRLARLRRHGSQHLRDRIVRLTDAIEHARELRLGIRVGAIAQPAEGAGEHAGCIGRRALRRIDGGGRALRRVGVSCRSGLRPIDFGGALPALSVGPDRGKTRKLLGSDPALRDVAGAVDDSLCLAAFTHRTNRLSGDVLGLRVEVPVALLLRPIARVGIVLPHVGRDATLRGVSLSGLRRLDAIHDRELGFREFPLAAFAPSPRRDMRAILRQSPAAIRSREAALCPAERSSPSPSNHFRLTVMITSRIGPCRALRQGFAGPSAMRRSRGVLRRSFVRVSSLSAWFANRVAWKPCHAAGAQPSPPMIRRFICERDRSMLLSSEPARCRCCSKHAMSPGYMPAMRITTA